MLIIAAACTNDEISYNPGLVELESSQKGGLPFIRDSILSDFSILKLETPDGIFLGSIDKLIFTKHRIFISDTKMMNSVFIFDLYGQYINHLEGGFKGPGEFIRPQSITSDFKSDELYVFDDKLQKLIHYDPDGEFLSEFKMKYTANDVAKLNDDYFAFNSGYPQIDNKVNSYDLICTSGSGKISNKFLPLRDWRVGTIFNKNNAFTEYMDTVWYCPVYNDTIYRLTESSLKPVYHFNMDDKFIDDKLANRIKVDDQAWEYTHAIGTFLKAGNTIYLGYGIRDPQTGRKVRLHVFCDIDSKNIRSASSLTGSGLSDGLFTGPISSTGDYFVGTIEAFQAKRSLEWSMEGKEFSEERMEFYLNLSENDNPLLIFYKVAPF